MIHFKDTELLESQLADGVRWREFLRVAHLSCGLYLLPAGGKDEQQPHSEAEVYYVLDGRGEIHVSGEDQPVARGSLVFVAAHEVHYFHSITADLHILVFFAPAEGSRAGRLLAGLQGEYELSTDPARLDLDLIHRTLRDESYWAAGISRERVARSIENALCFAIYSGGVQVAFGRVITDYATFAYISDVFTAGEHRGRGLALWLVGAMLAHPDLQGLRKWVLHTRDAQPLYRRLGFRSFEGLPGYMEFRP